MKVGLHEIGPHGVHLHGNRRSLQMRTAIHLAELEYRAHCRTRWGILSRYKQRGEQIKFSHIAAVRGGSLGESVSQGYGLVKIITIFQDNDPQRRTVIPFGSSGFKLPQGHIPDRVNRTTLIPISSGIDLPMNHRDDAQFTPGIRPPQEHSPEQSEPAYWFLFQGARLLVLDHQPPPRSAPRARRNKQPDMARSSDIAAPGPVSLPCLRDPAELNLVVVARQYLGSFRPGADEEAWRQATPIHCYSGEVSLDSRLPAPLISLDLRELWGRIDASLFTLAGRAKQIVQWDRDHQFCGRCARPLLSLDYDRAKRCPACDLTSYPRISPAIITAITRTVAGERQILLVRSPRFPPGMYSVVAGFVEPGESLEQCVEREVWEEVGLRVRRIRYFGSQPDRKSVV